MVAIDSTPQRMVLKSGSTTMTLDKETGKLTMQRKLLFWSLKPMEKTLADVVDSTVDAGVDRASGIDVCNTMLIFRDGGAWALSAADKKDATETAGAVRAFLGLRPH